MFSLKKDMTVHLNLFILEGILVSILSEIYNAEHSNNAASSRFLKRDFKGSVTKID